MKVICIKEGKWICNKGNVRTDIITPVNGEIYTVIDCKMVHGNPSYHLKEIPIKQNGIEEWWGIERFIPLDTYKKEELEKELKSIPCLT